MINVLKNQWWSVTLTENRGFQKKNCTCQICLKMCFHKQSKHTILILAINYVFKAILMILGLFYRNLLNFSANTGADV